MAPHPMLMAFLFCDHITRNVDRKAILVEIFSDIGAVTAPATLEMNIFVCLKECQGDYTFSLQLFHLTEEETLIHSEELTTAFDDRFSELELIFRFENKDLILPKFGRYCFKLLANNGFVAEKTFNVKEITKIPN